ncbi:hypothetical protein V5298_00305 [Alteromonas sp. 14N.309.X.WAT.G.H12]
MYIEDMKQDVDVATANLYLKETQRKAKNNLRSIEELDLRYFHFCKKNGLDSTMGPESLLFTLEMESPCYRYIERYLTLRDRAFEDGLFLMSDVPLKPTPLETKMALKAVMKELEELAELDTETLIESVKKETEDDGSPTIDVSVSMPERNAKTTLPCLSSVKKETSPIQFGLIF